MLLSGPSHSMPPSVEVQTLRPPSDQRTHGILRGSTRSCLWGLHLLERGQAAYCRIWSDCKRFKTRKTTEEYVAQVLTLDQPPLLFPDAVFCTDGMTFLSSGIAGWGVYAYRSDNSDTSSRGAPCSDRLRSVQLGGSFLSH